MKKTFFKTYKELMQKFLSGVGHSMTSAEQMTEFLYEKFEVEDLHLADDSYYFGIIKYFEETVIPHKIEVFNAGRELCRKLMMMDWEIRRMQDRLLYHDFSKFSCNEHIAYTSYNFKDRKKNSPQVEAMFQKAWNHHKHNNDHHPEHWLSVNRDGSTIALEMDKYAIIEMVADWIGAGKSYGSTLEEWLPSNIETFTFHPKTARNLSYILNNITGMYFRAEGQNVKVMKESLL